MTTWTILQALVLSSPLALAGQSVAERAPADTRPNVLWLTVEDMSPWIGPYGDETVPTPRLDAFAAEALRFDNAFASSPVCAPARSALLLGTDPTRMGAMHMRVRSRSSSSTTDVDRPLYEAVPPPFVEPFPRTLRRAGVHTTNNSKTDYQFVAPADTWNDSSGRAHYSDAPVDSPFFAVFNHGGTHESQAFPEAERRPSALTAEEVPVPPIYPDTPAVRDALKRTYDNIAAMDTWFGEHLDALEASGLADDTIVFFFSDHGVGLPRGKRSLYGTGTRVPLLVRFPAKHRPKDWAPGSSTDRVVSFVDFGPTVLSLMGVAPDPRLDGRAFLGAHAAAPRALAFFHADRFDGALDRARGVTDGTRLAIRNHLTDAPHLIANAYRERLPMTQDLYDLRDGEHAAWRRTPAQWQVGSLRRPEVEWYDRRDDPWEVRNLRGMLLPEAERAAFGALDDALARWCEETGDLGLLTDETAMVRERLWPPAGEQPTTAPPRLDAEGRLSSPTEGAWIAVRDPGIDAWRPYDGEGLVPDEGGRGSLEARAHRIGYRPSEVVRLDP